MPTVAALAQARLSSRGFSLDAGQVQGLEALEHCCDEWAHYKSRRGGRLARMLIHPPLPMGVYLWGGVGRGKSFLMDCFFDSVPIERKIRVHFHEFMRATHRELHDLRGTENPLDEVATRVARRYRLICFDEFHVADVTDAMILHRVLDAMQKYGIGMVTTSNFQPDGLYPDGLHRDRILPAIELLKRSMEVINVDNGTDYRRRVLEHVKLYHCPLGPETEAEMEATFSRLAEAHDEDPVLHIESRDIRAIRRAGGVVWFDFRTLCGGPRSQNDYLEIASQFHTVLVSNVPYMPVNMASQARRFTWLVDVLYDRRVKLVLSAAVPAEQLYTEGPLAYEFPRTVSRLNEMQSQEYLLQERRDVDTALT